MRPLPSIGLLFMAQAPSAHAETSSIVSLMETKPGSRAMAPLATRSAHLARKISGSEPFEDATWWHVVRFNGGRAAVGLDQHEGYWTARSDLDGDGVVETTRLIRHSDLGPPNFEGVVESTIEVQRPESLGGGTATVPYRLEISVQVDGEAPPTVAWSTDRFRMGQLPDGTAFAIYSAGGRYDLARAKFIVDENGDDAPDYGNRLVHYRVSEGVLTAHGNSWTFEIDPAGERIAFSPSDRTANGLRVGSPAPDFKVTSTDGNAHRLADYRGAPLLLDFWATWCAPCIALHPEVDSTAREYGVAVLGISADVSTGVLKRYLREHPSAWPSAAIGTEGAVNKAYEVNGWPTHALIDAEGKLRCLGHFSAVTEALEGMRRQGELPAAR